MTYIYYVSCSFFLGHLAPVLKIAEQQAPFDLIMFDWYASMHTLKNIFWLILYTLALSPGPLLLTIFEVYML